MALYRARPFDGGQYLTNALPQRAGRGAARASMGIPG